MKKVFLRPPYSPLYSKNGVFQINNGHNIFWKFDQEILKNKIAIKTIDLDSIGDGDSYIYIDMPYPWEMSVWKKIFAHMEKNILMCFESPIVSPLSHIRTFHRFFSKIYTWDDHLIDNKKYFKLHVPQLDSHLYTKAKEFKKKKLLVLINSKKSLPFFFRLLSLSKIDLFHERIKAIDYFDAHTPEDFSLYGKGWEKKDPFKITEQLFGFKKYISYKQTISDDSKIEVLSGYKFCICFENTAADGYITEKIFDCLKARCVPVYWGAPNISKYIDKKCFIDYREFMDYEKLLNYLNSMSEATYNMYIESIEKLINDKTIRKTWFEEGFKKLFIDSVQ